MTIARDKSFHPRNRIDAELANMSIVTLLLCIESEQSMIAANKELLKVENSIQSRPKLADVVGSVIEYEYH
jgi:hypothetical protein